MPTAATTAGGTRQETGGKGNKATRPVATVPFIRASAEHLEPAGIDVARIITGNVQQLGVFDIPAYGYVRSIVLLVEATTGTGTGAVAAEDGPWSVLQDIALTEPNGAVIAQFNNGFELFLANKWGGYRPNNDPRSSPVFSAVAGTGVTSRFFSVFLSSFLCVMLWVHCPTRMRRRRSSLGSTWVALLRFSARHLPPRCHRFVFALFWKLGTSRKPQWLARLTRRLRPR
jgi:hypothetical protein